MEYNKKPTVLVIDDSESVLYLLNNILNNTFNVITVNNAEDGLNLLNNSIDTIIVDLMMPNMDGIEFIKGVRSDSELRHLPIIVLTAKYNTEEDIAGLFDMGVNDYIVKPFYSAELLARVKTHINMKLLTDNLLEANKQLHYSASHDELTNIYNRSAFINFLDNEILKQKRQETNLLLLMFDVDHFKDVNDNYGHQIGDYILQNVIKLTKDIIREVDVIGRFGGDEFIILLSDTDMVESIKIAERLLKKISEHIFQVNTFKIHTSISIGISQFKLDYTLDKFIEYADNALYMAKRAGRNCIKIK